MRNILITGSGSGLGAELAKVYSGAKVRIILVGRDKDKLKITEEEIGNSSFESDILCCDISDTESINKLGLLIKNKYGQIDKLINCAGVGYFGSFPDMSLKEIDNMLNINVRGTILLTQKLLPSIKTNVMNIISTAGLKGKVNEAVYVASKFAIRGFTESLQLEYKNSGISFTAVYMGGMSTPFWSESDHIKDKSRLKSPSLIAGEIKRNDDGRDEIIL